VQTDVLEGLSLLASVGLTFDVSAEFPKHLKHIPAIAERIPNLKIVIDHLAKPPIKQKQMEPWASQMKLAASYPNVYAKISGLNTAADWDTWSASDIQPYIDYAFEAFGAERLMFGSDWPVANLAGDYGVVWEATRKALQDRSPAEKASIFGGTAKNFYNL
jgi:L-fuconolactonase